METPSAETPTAREGFLHILASKYYALDSHSRVLILVLLLLQFPLLHLVLNRTFLEFDLDRTTYEHMHLIERVRTGQPVYAPVSPEHVSITYTPMYWWISGFVCKVAGSSLIWPRLVSLASAGVFAVLIAAFVWRGTKGDLLLSLAAPCFVLSTNLTGPWLNAVNLNALHFAFGIAGFFCLSLRLTPATVVGAAILFCLSTLTKQTGLAYLLAAALFVFVSSWRLGLLYAGVSLATLGGLCLWLDASTSGEFYRQVVSGAKGPPWLVNRLWSEVVSGELFGQYGLMLASAFVPLLLVHRRGLWRILISPQYVLCGAGIAVACVAQPKLGSGSNHVFMAFAGLAICGCIGLAWLSRNVPGLLGKRLKLLFVAIQLTVVMIPGLRDYTAYLADDLDRRKYETIAEIFRAGKTCMYGGFVYLPVVFGQPPSGHYGDELSRWTNSQMDFANKPDSLVEPFRRQEFDYVIMDLYGDQSDPTIRAVLENYTLVAQLPAHKKARGDLNMRFGQVVLQANRLVIPKWFPPPHLTVPSTPEGFKTPRN